MRNKQRVYILAGPTAAGKSAVVHRLARQHRLPVLSADSMAVYQGLDIGTAKPNRTEQREVLYYGIDLIAPTEPFSVGDYLGYVHREVHEESLFVTGGTGLYITCLLSGLDRSPPPDPAFRADMEQLLNESGLPALQDYARRTASDAYACLKDPDNPRRIIRALEKNRQEQAASARPDWKAHGPHPLLGLRWERAALHERIEQRVHAMYAGGLPEEAETLLACERPLSRTAEQAIGYCEAFAWLRGAIPREEAVQRTIIRTRQLAKRQMTWLNHQFAMRWVDVHNADSVQDLADRVWDAWQQMPPACLYDETEN